MQKLIRKLTCLFRAYTRESNEAFVDASDVRIFTQQIHECEGVINVAKKSLAHLVAEKLRLQKECSGLRVDITSRESSLLIAIRTEQKPVVNELATSVSNLQAQLNQHLNYAEQLQEQQREVEIRLKSAIQRITQCRNELRVFQASSYAHQASNLIENSRQGVEMKFSDMQQSIDKISEKQLLDLEYLLAVKEVETYWRKDNDIANKLPSTSKEKNHQMIIERVKNKGLVAENS